MWPAVIVQKLFPQLPDGYVAAPGVHRGTVTVCVSLVDVVTIRDFNLYADVLEFIGGSDPARGGQPPCLYTVTMCGLKRPRQRSLLETWFYPMHIGGPLPTVPIWLDVDLSIDLELETSYEETCRFLRIS